MANFSTNAMTETSQSPAPAAAPKRRSPKGGSNTKTKTGPKTEGTGTESPSAAETSTLPAIEVTAAPGATDRVLVTIQQGTLIKAIEAVMSAIPTTQGPEALLDRLRLTTDPVNQTLRLTGFNLVVGLEMSVPANVEGFGDWSSSASKTLSLLRYFPSGPVTLSWSVGEPMSIVSRTAGPFEVTTRLADDCPTIPVPAEPVRLKLKNLQWGLKCVCNSAGTEDYRCVHLNLWQPDNDGDTAGITLTATKQEALLAFYYDIAEGTDFEQPDYAVAIAAAQLQKLVALVTDECQVELSTQGEDVVVRFVIQESQGKLSTATTSTTTVLTCRTDKVEPLSGHEFIPSECPVDISIDRALLVAALNRHAVVADGRAAVTFNVKPGEVALSAAGAGVGSGSDNLSAQVKGDPMTVRFNPELLLECLCALQSGQARLSLSGEAEPIYIRDPERQTLFFVLAAAGQ